MLLTVAGSVASTLDMRPLLERVFDALSRVLDYSAIAVLTLNETGEVLTIAAKRGPNFFTSQEFPRVPYSVADLGEIWDRLSDEEPIVIPDIHAGTAEASVIRGLLGDQLLDERDTFLRSFMWVPLVVRGHIIGIFTITSASPSIGSTSGRRRHMLTLMAASVSVNLDCLFVVEGVRVLETQCVLAARQPRIQWRFPVVTTIDVVLRTCRGTVEVHRGTARTLDRRRLPLTEKHRGRRQSAACQHPPRDGGHTDGTQRW